MDRTWVPIKDIPKEGLTFPYSLTQENSKAIIPSSLEYIIKEPITAEITLQVEETGVFVSGSFTGKVSVPCSFCLEPTTISVGHLFYDFVETLESTTLEDDAYLRFTPNTCDLEINIAAILFEEFLLDCSGTIRCTDACLGLCPKCGINKNISSCTCVLGMQDPRFEKLRSIVLEKKK